MYFVILFFVKIFTSSHIRMEVYRTLVICKLFMYLIILDSISFLENISKRARRILYGKVDNKPIICKG